MLTAAHKNVIIGSRANTLQIPFFRTHQNLLTKCSGSLLVLRLPFWVWQLLAASEGLSSSRNCPTVSENPMIWIIYFQGDFYEHFHHVTHDGYYESLFLWFFKRGLVLFFLNYFSRFFIFHIFA